jgi:hypothetical protein
MCPYKTTAGEYLKKYTSVKYQIKRVYRKNLCKPYILMVPPAGIGPAAPGLGILNSELLNFLNNT